MILALRNSRFTFHANLAALLVIGVSVGCSNRQGTVPNPFLSADRVPPPSTRMAIPGGQPAYYPGDPAMQAQPGFAPQQTYQQPVPGYVPPPAAPYQSGAVQPSPQAAASSLAAIPAPTGPVGPAVGIPTDDRPLRFAAAQPAATPAPEQLAQAATAPAPFVRDVAEYTPPRPQPQANQQFAPQEFNQQPAHQQRAIQQVALTTGTNNRPIDAPAFSPQQETSDGLPWNAGSAPRQSVASGYQQVPTIQAGYQQPTGQYYPAPSYPPSYHAQPVAPATRVRLPGYPTPQQSFVTPAGVAMPQGAAMQTNLGSVQITELPPQTVRPVTATAPVGDGFRSRSI